MIEKLLITGTRLDYLAPLGAIWICPVQYSILGQQSGGDPPAAEVVAATEASPDPSPPAPPLDPADAAADAAADPPEPPAAPAAPAAPTPAADWKDRRIATLTARLREEQRQKAAAPADSPPAPAPAADQAELDRLVTARAAEMSAVDEFNRRCSEVVDAGKAAHPDFLDRVNDLKGLVDFGNLAEATNYNQFLLAALETGEAPTLLHRLGGNLNEAMRLLALSPMKMAVELTKMVTAAPPAETSGAPRPIRPPGGAPAGSRDPIAPDDPERADRLTTAEWMRRRNAQEAARGDGRRGRV